MKKFFYLAIFSVLLSGCSSAPPGENAVRYNTDISELNNPNQNSLAQNTANQELSGTVLTGVNGSQQMSGGKKSADNNAPPIAPNVKPNTQPAPDNSEMQATMNNQGQPIEMRVFKNHPALSKVEKVYVELDKPIVKVYLKNGKTVEVAAGRISNPMTASAAEIIAALPGGNPVPAATKPR